MIMSHTNKTTVARSKTRSRTKLVRFALEPRKVLELRRALMLAMHHTMSTAKPEERSAAAMEAAEYAGSKTMQGAGRAPSTIVHVIAA